MCVTICEVGYTQMETPAKEQPPSGTRNNFLRRKTNLSTALPTLLTLYCLGAGIAFIVCTRTFVSFQIFSPEESQAPVQLLGQEDSASALEVLEERIQSPAQTLRVVRSIADSRNFSSVGSFGNVDVPDAPVMDDSDEPEFMQQPVLRSKSPKTPKLQARLKRMTSLGRRRWLAAHWSSFQILKEDDLSRQFQDRMQQFFCSEGPPASPIVDFNHTAAASSVAQMDEREICAQGNSSSPARLLCRQRFILTWMSPVSFFGPRERLSLESIFKWHPHACVVILSRTMDSPPGRKILEPFVGTGYRVTAVTPGLASLFADIPAAKWYRHLRDGSGDPGCINLMQNLSNLMRLAALYKYGGVYLDTDVIVLKPFDELRNAVGTQTQNVATGRWTRLNNAVLVFERAHPVVLEFLREFANTFDGSRWGWNGPYLVSRVVEKVRLWPNSSSPVSVLPLQAFYPVNWIAVVHFFRRPGDERQSKQQAKKLEWMQQGSYAIHLWNKKSYFLKVEEGSIMETLFKQSCLFSKVSGS